MQKILKRNANNWVGSWFHGVNEKFPLVKFQEGFMKKKKNIYHPDVQYPFNDSTKLLVTVLTSSVRSSRIKKEKECPRCALAIASHRNKSDINMRLNPRSSSLLQELCQLLVYLTEHRLCLFLLAKD